VTTADALSTELQAKVRFWKPENDGEWRDTICTEADLRNHATYGVSSDSISDQKLSRVWRSFYLEQIGWVQSTKLHGFINHKTTIH